MTIRRTAHLRTLGLLVVVWALALAPAASAQSPLRITFLDVGQADAVLLRAPEGQTALIDAGAGDVTAMLAELGVERIDLLVATHPHADHIGGMVGVLERVPVRFYMDNGRPHTTATYRALLATLQRRTDVTYLAAEPRTLDFGGAEIEVLPLPAPGTVDHNDRSVGLVVSYGSFRAFLSGDSERRELAYFLSVGAVPDVTLLKAPHHGADNGFTSPFLRAARPEVVVVSVGANAYGHPRPEALSAYAAVAEGVYRTDLQGQVTVLGWEDGRYEVFAGATLMADGRERADAEPAVSATRTDEVDAKDRAGGVGIQAGGGVGSAGVEAGPGPVDVAAVLALGVFADAPGNDHQNTNGEYVTIENRSAADVRVGGWRLCDLARHCFLFPSDAVLPAGGRVVVHTGRGVSDGVRFFMNSGRAVWNNDGDTATLYDRSGSAVLTYSYR